MENKTKEFLINYRKEADFINERYGLGDEDHDTALDRGHIYDLMRQFALSSVVGQSEQLKAFKNDETVVLDGALEVKIINIESKVLVRVIEDDTLIWVKKDRLKKEYSL